MALASNNLNFVIFYIMYVCRLWRDLFTGCVTLYYELFYYMEDSGILNIDNEIHIFCLHFIFLPRINRSINQFIAMWNNHPIRTAGNFSPTQLWMTGSHPMPSDVCDDVFSEIVC